MRLQSVRKCAPVCGVVGLVAFGTATPARAANLLINPGFEAPTDDTTNVDSLLSGWTFVNDCQRATFYNHTTGGKWSVWQKTFEPAGGGITQNVAVTVGATYTLTAQELFEPTYPTTSAFIQLGLTWLDSGNSPVGTPALTSIDPASITTTGVWTPYSVMGVAPAGATQVQVFFGWTGGGTVPGQQNVFTDDADLEGVGSPPTNSVWIVNASGDWNVSGNWANGVVPTGIGIEADFFSAITNPHTVFSDIAVTAGTLNFNNVKTYVIGGAGSLTLQTSTGNAQVIVQQGTQEINLPTTIASNTVFNVSSGATLVIADPLTINAGKTVTAPGAGTVTYESIITVLTAGAITFGNATHAAGLNLQSSATATMTPHTGASPSILQLDSISFASSSAKLDLSNNELIVSASAPTVRAELIAGNIFTSRHGGVLGYNDIGGGKTEVRFTLLGDTNLDGKVDVTDLGNLASNYGKTAGGIWVQGDFDYNNTVDVSDLGDLASSYGNTVGLGTALGGDNSANALAAAAVGNAAVPEPTSLGLVGVGAASLMFRRRRAR